MINQLHAITLTGIIPGLARLPSRMDSPEARIMLYAIGLQESMFLYRRQLRNGPARSFWQMERGGGVWGVLHHDATRRLALNACEDYKVPADSYNVWKAIEHNDPLATIFARLLLYSDPRSLPSARSADEAWEYYLRNWRPGKPHPKTWPGYHRIAVDFVQEQMLMEAKRDADTKLA